MDRPIRLAWVALAAWLVAATATAAPTVVFSTDFASGLPPEFSAPGSVLEGVQGYAGLGPTGRKFAGSFLRYTSAPILPTSLTVRNLPAHDHLSVRFLLGLIDSWDGTELMQISVDGVLKFNHWFQLATGDTTDYTPAPAGAILSIGHDLGFSGCCFYNRDRAYDLGVDPAFNDIPHTADSVVVTWTIGAISGPAAGQWQGGSDESWAIDAVSVEVSSTSLDAGDGALVQLALRALANPLRDGRVRLQLALPGAAPAQLELVDLVGRRLATREVHATSAGWQDLELVPDRPLGPGVYWARLRQGTHEATLRFAVVR